jgi:hypothetical protein
VTDLTAWLLEQIASDEAAARAALSNQCDPENGWGAELSVSGRWVITPHVGVIHEEVQARHVEAWNPARVLAECRAKRAVLAIWRRTNRVRGECAEASDTADLVDDIVVCMAQGFEGRPGWDPAWTLR